MQQKNINRAPQDFINADIIHRVQGEQGREYKKKQEQHSSAQLIFDEYSILTDTIQAELLGVLHNCVTCF